MTKLSKSVSVAELMHMREVDHLSNRDISKRLGISIRTVYRYIGNQPAGLRKPYGSSKKDKLPPLTVTPLSRKNLPGMCPLHSAARRCLV